MNRESVIFAQFLRAAREAKGLSQRELSARARVPQAHISKIENGTVDLRVSSLVALARALDLELTLVPRKVLSAVQSIARSSEPVTTVSAVPRELSALRRLLFSVPTQAQKPREVAQLQRLLRDLHRIPLTEAQRDALKQVTASLMPLQEIVGGNEVDAIKAYVNGAEGLGRIQAALARIQRLRNDAAHGAGVPRPDTVRPAYSLDEYEDEDV